MKRQTTDTPRIIFSSYVTVWSVGAVVFQSFSQEKQILQDIVRLQLDWDEQLPLDIVVRWEAWCSDIHNLDSLTVPRCYKPKDFGKVKEVQLHHFSDASQIGYGQCSYVRMIDDRNQFHQSSSSTSSHHTQIGNWRQLYYPFRIAKKRQTTAQLRGHYWSVLDG